MMSMRRKLLIWLLGGLLIAGAGAGFATFLKTQEEVGEMLDLELRQIAYSMQHSSGTMAEQIGSMEDSSTEDNDFLVQIWDSQGKRVFSTDRSIELPLSASQGLANIRDASGNSWRVFRLTSADRVIQAAQPEQARWETAMGIALRMLAPIAVMIPVLAFLVWMAVKVSLAPLAAVKAEVELRDSFAMDPLDPGAVPDEVRPLLIAINGLLDRLNQSIIQQSRFVADAAHELRTPLTALMLQAQLAEEADDPEERALALGNLRQGIARASHLVNQLLTLARHGPEAHLRHAQLNLAALVRQVAGEYAPLASSRRIDLGIDAPEQEQMNGNEDALRILTGNLLDNAIRYTPAGGRVDVALYHEGDSLVLTVHDTGPGIPVEKRARVFERFYRIEGSEVQGSGLGLAIAEQIALQHKGTIEASAKDEGTGALLRVRLPMDLQSQAIRA